MYTITNKTLYLVDTQLEVTPDSYLIEYHYCFENSFDTVFDYSLIFLN